MNPCPGKTKRSTRGALMAAALLLMLASGIFMGAWVSLMSTRAAQVSYMETAVQRRVSVGNSRQFSWQCALDKAFEPNNDLSANQTGVFAGNAGGLSTGSGWTDLNVYKSTDIPGVMTTVFPYNYTGMRPMDSYLNREQFSRPTALTGVDNFAAHLFLKTYCPMLAGDLFITYRKPSTSPSELDVYANTSSHVGVWKVEGRTVIRSPESLFARTTAGPLQLPFYTRSLYIQSHDSYNSRAILGTDLNGQRLLPSNMPAEPSTTGPVSGTASESFKGYLNVIRNDINPDNSLWHFMEREQTAGRSSYATIDVFSVSATTTGPYWMEEQSTPTYPPPGWPSGYPPKLRVLIVQLNHASLPHLRIHGVVDQIIFKGQTNPSQFSNAGLMSPVMFAIVPMNSTGPSVRDIRFERDNNRRIVIGAQHWNAATLDISWGGNPGTGTEYLWRTVFINEYQTVMLNMPANVTRTVRWIGGVMTNWAFKRRVAGGVNASRLVFAADSSLTT
ncbi:MAG: hypothetical protein U0984_16590, partial [Prosthecobacter sp.]|nr:hypothetical protein [Prosthecobacter sp.]